MSRVWTQWQSVFFFFHGHVMWRVWCVRDVTHAWDVSHMHGMCQACHMCLGRVNPNVSCHIWMSHVTYKGVMSQQKTDLFLCPCHELESRSLFIRDMGWLQLVGSFTLQVSFAEYSLYYRALMRILRRTKWRSSKCHFSDEPALFQWDAEIIIGLFCRISSLL